jgi:hypothetical protein
MARLKIALQIAAIIALGFTAVNNAIHGDWGNFAVALFAMTALVP